MIHQGNIKSHIKNKYRRSIDLIFEISKEQYERVPAKLNELIPDLVGLYLGEWDTHEACQVGYHKLGHALDVSLAAARMIVGWNKVRDENERLSADNFLLGITAALFHDSGYIKDRGDNNGFGGKFSFSHVSRSKKLVTLYLEQRNWPRKSRDLIAKIIQATEFNEDVKLEGVFSDPKVEIIAKMVASADLIAQMADVDYLRRINDLFEEFVEAYKFEGQEKLIEKGIHIFSSAQELIEGTMGFYEQFVLPRLHSLDRMDQYLTAFFGDGRNPYLENIAANLSGHLMDKRTHWRRLGEVLEDLGVVDDTQIKKALSFQKEIPNEALQECKDREDVFSVPFRKRLLTWMNRQFARKCLGDILMEMDAIEPSVLRQGLLSQMLPQKMTNELTHDELLFLLQSSMLLQNIHKGPWVFAQILEMANEILDCEASSILLVNPESNEMVIALPSGPKKDFLKGKTISVDKGISGWVFRHNLPVVVSNAQLDARFGGELDNKIDFHTRSILAVPMAINGEVIGVLESINKKSALYTDHDMDIMLVLANILAISMGCTVWMQEICSE
jgi:hypothetical protein